MKGNEDMSLTWRQLREYLHGATDEQLDQEVQCTAGMNDEPVPLSSGIAIGTVREMFHAAENELDITFTRSPYDNKHHPEHLVLITDVNLFAEDGHIATDIFTGEKIWPGGDRRCRRCDGDGLIRIGDTGRELGNCPDCNGSGWKSS